MPEGARRPCFVCPVGNHRFAQQFMQDRIRDGLAKDIVPSGPRAKGSSMTFMTGS
ncbi:hypothetical protein [Pseudarthrobacter sulfonivorans]|uniref:hypothetical protein n=1 Tax=Pseudarthrobacter sulfonivorans TaxID=121292 RepID=UPI000B2BA182|nr:hypothetical protein [Pseudarthrobacter sulfonivorans]